MRGGWPDGHRSSAHASAGEAPRPGRGKGIEALNTGYAEFESRSPAETEAIGHDLAKNLEPGSVILLYGDLGAGKSVLARGIIHALPGGEDRHVRSPTYVYVHHHPTQPPVHHIDLYRLPLGGDPAELGLEEWADSRSLTIIEWAERLEEYEFPHSTRIYLDILAGDLRRIQIQSDEMKNSS